MYDYAFWFLQIVHVTVDCWCCVVGCFWRSVIGCLWCPVTGDCWCPVTGCLWCPVTGCLWCLATSYRWCPVTGCCWCPVTCCLWCPVTCFLSSPVKCSHSWPCTRQFFLLYYPLYHGCPLRTTLFPTKYIYFDVEQQSINYIITWPYPKELGIDNSLANPTYTRRHLRKRKSWTIISLFYVRLDFKDEELDS